MCTSPHEWSTPKLEEYIQMVKGMLEQKPDDSFWKGRLENMEALLKWRAEKGTMLI